MDLRHPATAPPLGHLKLPTQAEVEQLVGLGATVIRESKDEFGVYWATLQDPEGNELCIGAK